MNILNKKLGQKLLASAAFWIAQAIFVSLLYAGAGGIFGALSDLSNALSRGADGAVNMGALSHGRRPINEL